MSGIGAGRVEILKNPIHIYSDKLTNIFNESLINGKFPDTLKIADVTPIFKKGDDNEKENCRPVSMFSTFSEVFEKLLFEQISNLRSLSVVGKIKCSRF